MSKQFNTRIQHKIDTYENWSKAENFIPLLGELVIYTTNEKGEAETKIKIGDGTTNVNDLEFAVAGSATGEAGFAQSDWAQTNTQAADYIKNKPGDEYNTKKTIFLTDSIIIPEASTNTIPGFYASQIFYETDKKLQNGDMITFTTLLDNISLSSQLIVDETLDEAFGMASYQTGYFATFNTLENILEAVQAGLPKTDENIPYSFGIVLVYEGDNDYSLVIVSPRNDLSHREVKIEISRAETGYIKLSNNALDIDLEPIENSDNLITSGGVYEALDSIKTSYISDYDNTTSHLDACITEGEYIYYNNGYNIECKLIVKNNDIEGIRTSIIQVLICTTLVSFEDAVDPFKVGIQWRTGEHNRDGSIVWEDFNYVLTDKELYTLIPEHNENGLVLTTNLLSNRDYKWDKPKYVPTPKDEDIGKCLVATSTDPHAGYTWEDLSHLELPVIKDVAGFTELDKATESGVYRYIADNGLETVLFVSEYNSTLTIQGQEVNGKVITQLILKTTGTMDLSNDNLGRGLIGPGVFIRTGVGNNQNGEFNFSWAYDGKFSNIHDLPKAPTNAGHHILKSIINDNNELIYNWENLYGEPLEEILNSVSTWLDSQMTNVAFLDKSNTFNGAQTIKGNLNIEGNIFQTGDNYITHAEHVYTEDDYIVLREGAQTAMTGYAGFEIQNYDGNNTTGHLVFDNTGTARVGDVGYEQALTTRVEANQIEVNSVALWKKDEKTGAPYLDTGFKIITLTQEEYDALEIKASNTLYLIKEG